MHSIYSSESGSENHKVDAADLIEQTQKVQFGPSLDRKVLKKIRRSSS